MLRLHRPLVVAVVDTLQQIMEAGVYADKAVEQVLKSNPKWGARDRRFIAETIYDMVRWWRTIRFACDKESGKYTNYYHLFASWMILKGEELPDWQEWKGLNKDQIEQNREEGNRIRTIRHSFPDWMDDLLVEQLGAERTDAEMAAMNEEADLVIRVNSLKTTKDIVRQELLKEDLPSHSLDGYPEALVLEKRKQLSGLQAYRSGHFEIQDASSQLIAANLELREQLVLIDACAGAGGKSLHSAALMQNKGKIISMDVEERKLLELERRATRAGVSIVQTKVIRPGVVTSMANTADRLLLDVPCSGLGVIRRNPDAKWKLTAAFMDEVMLLQRRILKEYSVMLKKDGIMVYATCSILPGENERQVELFLSEHPGFELLLEQKILPSEGFDGFYLAKMIRKQ